MKMRDKEEFDDEVTLLEEIVKSAFFVIWLFFAMMWLTVSLIFEKPEKKEGEYDTRH